MLCIDCPNSSSSSNDDAASRLTELKDGAVSLVKYDYLGLGTVVGTTYDEPDVFCKRYNVANNAYSNLDRYNRIVKDTWTKDLSSDVNFYDCDITWDRNGNITRIEDNVHTGFDVAYSVDDLDRITRAEEGTWNGSAITSRTRDQQWTLNHTGNWDREKLDLNGDGDFVDTDEHDDTRTHNTTNELLSRNTNSSGGVEHTLAYDDVGNLTDDDESYEYVYDPLGRLRKIKKSTDQTLVAEYYYDGLGQMVMRHEDTDADLDADGSDKKYWLVQDERWRWVGTFRESDASPKEEYVHHQAGLDGWGGSSYIDLVVLRDRDGDNADWTSAADGTMEERIYYGQNQHADVSAIVNSGGVMVEWVKYSAYGVPFGMPRGDTDSDGDCDAADRASMTGAYNILHDINLDNASDSVDLALASDATLGGATSSLVLNRRTFGGANASCELLHSRRRFFRANYGRWLTRDPSRVPRDAATYEYVNSMPIVALDPFGLSKITLKPIGFVLDSTVSEDNAAVARLAVYSSIAYLNGLMAKCYGKFKPDCDMVLFFPTITNPGPSGDDAPGGCPGPPPTGSGKGGDPGGSPSKNKRPKYYTPSGDGWNIDQIDIASQYVSSGAFISVLTSASIEEDDGGTAHGIGYEGEGAILDILGALELPGVLAHEMGHAVGLFVDGTHSADPTSIMASPPPPLDKVEAEWSWCEKFCRK